MRQVREQLVELAEIRGVAVRRVAVREPSPSSDQDHAAAVRPGGKHQAIPHP